jgi:hypothetical protein
MAAPGIGAFSGSIRPCDIRLSCRDGITQTAQCHLARVDHATVRRLGAAVVLGGERGCWSHAGADVLFKAPGATSRPLLDDFRVQELSDELDAETGIGSGVLGVELELGVGEVEPVGVDHDARRADDE